jgi:hypothetical protein
MRHRETLWLLVRAMLNVSSIALTTSGLSVLVLGGVLGPAPDSRVEHVLRATDPYRVYAGMALIFLSLYVAAHKAIGGERTGKEALAGSVRALQEELKPRLEFVVENCCHPTGPGMLVGVANPSMRTTHKALVYATIPQLGVVDRVLQWSGMARDESFDIHHAPLPRHHHTNSFASVGDRPGEFFFHFAYGHEQVATGTYQVELCAKGEDMPAAMARLEVVFTQPRSMRVRLVS